MKHIRTKFKKTCVRPIDRILHKFADREKKTLYKCRAILYAWIRKLNILKTAVLPKLTQRFTAATIKISTGFLKISKS